MSTHIFLEEEKPMMYKIKRYLKEMAADIKEKIQNDPQGNPEAAKKHTVRIDRAIWMAEAGFTTNIETISEIMAAYDDFVFEVCESC